MTHPHTQNHPSNHAAAHQSRMHKIESDFDETVVSARSTGDVSRNLAMVVCAIMFVFGALTGYMIYRSSGVGVKSGAGAAASADVEKVNTKTKAGIIDKKTFSDTAVGILREGGFEGEGSFHLERGAKDQTAYITSSTVDLQPFVGKKVEVWGKTYSGHKVGWLMDVGLVELVK